MKALNLNEMVALEGGLNANQCVAATLGSAVVGGLMLCSCWSCGVLHWLDMWCRFGQLHKSKLLSSMRIA